MIVFPEERVFALWFLVWEGRLTPLQSIEADKSDAGFISWVWAQEEPPVCSLPICLASTYSWGKALAAIYIWHVKEWVHIWLPWLLTEYGGAEQKQHIKAPFSKIFSRRRLKTFAVRERLKNTRKCRQSPHKVCYVCHGTEELTRILLEQEQMQLWKQDCCSGAPAAFNLCIFSSCSWQNAMEGCGESLPQGKWEGYLMDSDHLLQ